MPRSDTPPCAPATEAATRTRTAAWIGLVRPHHWSKNLLVFVPLAAVHRLDPGALEAVATFAAFSLAASATYIVNDVRDLEADRQHPSKRRRPLAAGEIGVAPALALAGLLALAALVVAATLPAGAAPALGAYAVLSLAYSFGLKRLALVDVITLATLYALRIIAGGFAVAAPVSAWLLAFSMFVFFSLALLKRHTEAWTRDGGGEEGLAGRGYRKSDEPVLLGLGTASAAMSVMVLALYINSEAVTLLYRNPQALWLLCPLALYWLGRCWLLSARGLMHDDPIVFAMRDPASYGVAALGAAVLAAAI